MLNPKLMVRAAVVGLAFAMLQGCTLRPEKAEEKSLTEAVTDTLYTKRMVITGSRIPRTVDVRKPIETQGSQTVRMVKVE